MRGIQLVRRPVFLAIAMSAGLSAAASADLSEAVFTVSATDASGRTGSYVVTQNMGSWDSNGKFTWSSNTPVALWDVTHTVQVGTLNPTALPSPGSAITVLDDPQINLNFAVQAGGSSTSFTITSALLSFPEMSGATGTASAGYSISDLTGDGVTLTGPSNGGAYLAQYNGFVPGGTTFFEAISSITAPAFESATENQTLGDTPIATALSDMSVQVNFTLSAFDLASGTTTYVVTPEPASAMLLGVAGLFVLARRGML